MPQSVIIIIGVQMLLLLLALHNNNNNNVRPLRFCRVSVEYSEWVSVDIIHGLSTVLSSLAQSSVSTNKQQRCCDSMLSVHCGASWLIQLRVCVCETRSGERCCCCRCALFVVSHTQTTTVYVSSLIITRIRPPICVQRQCVWELWMNENGWMRESSI